MSVDLSDVLACRSGFHFNREVDKCIGILCIHSCRFSQTSNMGIFLVFSVMIW